jgi:1,4-alpha-glucan branching enzyme
MFGHPGKKLLFMGQDIGQYREWSEEREVDWFLLQDKKNEHLQAYVRDLLMMYRKYPALYANDSTDRLWKILQYMHAAHTAGVSINFWNESLPFCDSLILR